MSNLNSKSILSTSNTISIGAEAILNLSINLQRVLNDVPILGNRDRFGNVMNRNIGRNKRFAEINFNKTWRRTGPAVARVHVRLKYDRRIRVLEPR